jgi:hypothetical protein
MPYGSDNHPVYETVDMHSEYGRNAHPAVNIKLLISHNDLTSRMDTLLPLDLGGVSDADGSNFRRMRTDEEFTLAWIEEHLDEDERVSWWQDACQENFEQGKELAERTWPDRTIEVYSEGRSGGWMVVFGLGDPEDWTPEQVATWATFKEQIRALVDDVPRAYLWAINANVFEPWALEQEDEAKKLTVLITGTPADGFRFIGPVTPNDPDLDTFIDTELRGQDWWYATLEPLPTKE